MSPSCRAFLSALLLAAVAVIPSPAGLAAPSSDASDQEAAALVAKPVALPDMVLGSTASPVTLVECATLTCPRCAAFAENVFPMLQSKYIDTGKVRFVSREFPLDVKAAAGSMLARCAAGGDAAKFFQVTEMLFKQQLDLVDHTTETLTAIGAKFGMAQPAVEACVKDDTTLDKLQADQNFAFGQLKVDATPTFFINGEKIKGETSFDEFAKKINAVLGS